MRDTEIANHRSGLSLGVTLRCRGARWPLAGAKRRQRAMDHLTFGGELELLDRLLDPKPAHVVGLVVVIAHVPF